MKEALKLSDHMNVHNISKFKTVKNGGQVNPLLMNEKPTDEEDVPLEQIYYASRAGKHDDSSVGTQITVQRQVK